MECGGGRRSWDVLETSLKTDTVRFLFVKGGQIYEARTHKWDLHEIVPGLHTRRINKVARINVECPQAEVDEELLVTAGEDTAVCVSDRYGLRERLRSHLSSVHCLCEMGPNAFCSGGGRSQLKIWKWSGSQFREAAEHTDLSAEFDVRYLSLAVWRKADTDFTVLFGSRSDGLVRVFGFHHSDCQLVASDVCLYAESENRAIITSLKLLDTLDSPVLIGITSSGCLCLWNVQNLSDTIQGEKQTSPRIGPIHHRKFNDKVRSNMQKKFDKNRNSDALCLTSCNCSATVENCGLSALEAKLISDESVICFVGSESGRISLVKLLFISDSWRVAEISAVAVHASNVTDMCICVRQNEVLYSISTDNRLVRWSLDKDGLHFSKMQTLCVTDPSSLAVLSIGTHEPNRIAICGTGLQTFQVEGCKSFEELN